MKVQRWNGSDAEPLTARQVSRDVLITAASLTGASLLCVLLRMMDEGDTYVSMIFLLAVAVAARLTRGYVYGIVASVVGVLGVNYAFTEPYFEFCLSISGYPLAFFSMLAVAVTTSAMTSQIKEEEKQRYRVRVEQLRGNLLRAISHDLRTPLTGISGAASVLLEQTEMSRENQEILLRQIVEDSDWLVRMVENLLSITRMNTGSPRLNRTSEAAEEIVAESVRKFRKRFDRIHVEIRLPDDLMLVPMDPILIGQVLTNLLENVAFHAKSAKHVCVRLRPESGSAVFEVIDDGAGIPPEKMEGLFEGKLGSDSDGQRGMGIGLSVCRAIIAAHGGEIEAENLPGGGACVRFRLPLEEGKDEKSDKYSDR